MTSGKASKGDLKILNNNNAVKASWDNNGLLNNLVCAVNVHIITNIGEPHIKTAFKDQIPNLFFNIINSFARLSPNNLKNLSLHPEILIILIFDNTSVVASNLTSIAANNCFWYLTNKPLTK